MVHRCSRFIFFSLVIVLFIIMQSAQVNAEVHSLVYDGKDYSIELTYDLESGISENAKLRINEFSEGTKEYQEYFSESDDYVKKESGNTLTFARFFDITILDDGNEIEPDETVEVSINWLNGIEKTEEEEIGIIHFTDNDKKELLEINEEITEESKVTEVIYEQDSFSVIGMIIFDGADTKAEEVGSEVITKKDTINIEKEWSDGYDNHSGDEVFVSLCENDKGKWNICDEIVLNKKNDWKGCFENLDKNKKYSFMETKVVTDNLDKTENYKSEIINMSEKRWSPVKGNQFTDGESVVLTFYDGKEHLLRRSGDYNEMNLRISDITIAEDDTYGKYLTDQVGITWIWDSIWDEENDAWLLYFENSEAYLTLSFNKTKKVYEWVTSREKTEGSCLNYENGMISATVNGVTKYLGNVSGSGPYQGLDSGDKNITKFQIYSYQEFIPDIFKIINTKNETVKVQELDADITVEKKIDYLGDGYNNPDTDIDDGKTSEKILGDLYRLYLDMKMKTDVTGLDLLLVIDVSSSMQGNYDALDAQGNPIHRAEALRQALNQFVPEFLPENTKNRLSIVAFETESVILQDWTQNPQEVVEKVNYTKNGTMPLYNGDGTNYEAALIRAHEAFTKLGYSKNARAMIFLSDGEPTICLKGNDDLEKGNVTVNLGEASVTDKGIVGTFPKEITILSRINYENEREIVVEASGEAVESFKNHNPQIMVGTIAFNTIITDVLKNLASEPSFVTQIENGSPADLIEAMELITDYIPKEIVITDELSENVELYAEKPDFRVTAIGDDEKEVVLYSQENLTNEGKLILDDTNPVSVEGKKIKLFFNDEYVAQNEYIYRLSFNINASQRAYNKYADTEGKYSDIGDKGTDYNKNATSSLKEGFYSNGDDTKVTYSINGAKNEKKYRKPVIQVEENSLLVKKVDLDGNIISDDTKFVLYRKAAEDESDLVTLDGVEDKLVKIAEGITDKKGEILFEHLRVSVFDDGYSYYLVEEEAPEGYMKYDKPIHISLFKNHIQTEEDNAWVYVENENVLTVRNAEYVEPVELPVTGGDGNFKFYIIGILLITGGLFMIKKKEISGFLMIVMTFVLAFQLLSVTAFAIDSTEKGKITVNSIESGVKVHAYRLMDVNYDYGVDQPKNPMYTWVEDVADWVHLNYPGYIDMNNNYAVKEAFSEASDREMALFYDKLAVAVKAGTTGISANTVTSDSDTVLLEGLTMGNYFLLIEGGVKVYRPLTANVVPEWKDNVWKMSTPVVEAKASEPSITKTVTNGLNKDNMAIGDTISYELNAVVPVYPENATAKRYIISDRLSSGLTLVDNSLKVYGVNSGQEDTLLTTGYTKGTKRPVNTDKNQVTFALEFDYDVIKSYKTLKVTYDAILNENAQIGSVGNKNSAFLDYNNNPYVSDSWKSDEDETSVVYSYGMKISKIDEDTNESLSGAQFTLSKDGADIRFAGTNGVYHVAKEGEAGNTLVTVNGDGKLTLNGLDTGIYNLTEVKAPNGYVKLQNPVKIELYDENMNGLAEMDDSEMSDGYIPVTVKNDKGFVLPITGGMGTTLFNLTGVILVGSGLLMMVVYFRKRRNSR